MPQPDDGSRSHTELAQEAVTQVRRWLADSRQTPTDRSAARLSGVLKDPDGLDFTIGFVDTVVRPEDLRVAGKNLNAVTRRIPRFLSWHLRAALRLGGLLGPVLPALVIPISRRVLRAMVGHLIVDATPRKLGAAIRKLRADGSRLNLNLLGEAVLGEREAGRRLAGTTALLTRNDVDYVSIKVSSVVSQLSMWAFDEAVEEIATRLTPLYELAATSTPAKFINLDMEEYKDLDLTIAVFMKLLDQPQLLSLKAGIVLQSYLPDALGALGRLTAWSQARRARGGAPIKVRIVKGANLAMERVDAIMHGWSLATYEVKQDTDTNYKRMLDYALTPERTDAVTIGVAGHNLFDLAFAWLLAGRREVRQHIEFEMLLGMASGQAHAVRKDVGELLLYTPVVHPAEFDVAIAYLVRRLEENASPENFLSAVFQLHDEPAVFEREKARFLASVDALDDSTPTPHRRQDRTREPGSREPGSREPGSGEEGFQNTPDTDPALAANRAWGRGILARVPHSRIGVDIIGAAQVEDAGALDRIISAAAGAGRSWGATTGGERAEILHRAGRELASRRAELIEVMASETGKTIAEGDPEVSEAVDFAHYYAEQATRPDRIEGATFLPVPLTVVTPPWNFPLAIPAGSTLAALAAGSAVIIKPARQAERSGAAMVEALWQAGVPRDVLTLVRLGERELGRQLVSHPLVGQVILTGGYETAELFRSWRADLTLHAETSGKNAIIVTPSADFDHAAADIVKSAFGHAGQKCSAASLVILVGSAGTSRRFIDQLVDATTSLRVGYPEDPTSQMGPIIEPAQGKLLRALTILGAGEEWLVEPRQLDDTGRLWSPGIRTGVRPGSDFHLTEFFGPVLGVMHAATLDEAIQLQNQVAYGLTGGLHSLEPRELAQWLDGVQAGNLYVNRGITGAVVQRQPFGGWKRSMVGAGAKAGGPNYLFGLGRWRPGQASSPADAALADVSLVDAALAASADVLPGGESFLGELGLNSDEIAYIARSIASDLTAWESEFGIAADVANLGVERNLLRYVPTPVSLRLSEGEPLAALVRVIAAATRAGSSIEVSSALPIPETLLRRLHERGTPVAVEDDATWLARMGQPRGGVGSPALTRRIRMLGGDPTAFGRATEGSLDFALYAWPATTAGRIELLPFLLEQSISITAHRFGNPDRFSDAVI